MSRVMLWWSTMGHTMTLAERFWSKVQITPGCWEWQAAKNSAYGVLKVGARLRRAHQISYEMHHGGPIPEGMVVRHKCDNPPCVNPDHLELGAPADNVRDTWTRGRATTARLTADDVRAIRVSDEPYRVLAKRYGVTPGTIYMVRARHTWKHVA